MSSALATGVCASRALRLQRGHVRTQGEREHRRHQALHATCAWIRAQCTLLARCRAVRVVIHAASGARNTRTHSCVATRTKTRLVRPCTAGRAHTVVRCVGLVTLKSARPAAAVRHVSGGRRQAAGGCKGCAFYADGRSRLRIVDVTYPHAATAAHTRSSSEVGARASYVRPPMHRWCAMHAMPVPQNPWPHTHVALGAESEMSRRVHAARASQPGLQL